MVKKIIFLMVFSFSSFSAQFSTGWDRDGNEVLTLTCQQETSCIEYCNSGLCQIATSYCRDCVGTNVYLTNIFQLMGERYQSSQNEVELLEFLDFLANERYFFFWSRSIYNVVTSFDHSSMRRKFQSLCSFTDPYPLVFFELTSQRKLGKIKYVLCQDPSGSSKIYRGVEAWDIYQLKE